MALIPSFIYPMSLLLCLAMVAGAHTEVTPSHDFTLSNAKAGAQQDAETR